MKIIKQTTMHTRRPVIFVALLGCALHCAKGSIFAFNILSVVKDYFCALLICISRTTLVKVSSTDENTIASMPTMDDVGQHNFGNSEKKFYYNLLMAWQKNQNVNRKKLETYLYQACTTMAGSIIII